MSDLAQILLLPPPPQQRLPAREQELAVNAEAQGGDTARGRRFRFRVHEGGEGGTDIATRRADSRVSVDSNERSAAHRSAEDATAEPSSGRIRYTRSDDSRTGNSSAFLAQAFAQEQLGEGLHNPPFAAASAAYTRTGAALNPPASAGVNLSV